MQLGSASLDPKDLRTHGVVVGMTGSGKTGLCVVLLEELVRAGVPVIAIDPKGDLGNLGLVFPQLQPKDFEPWTEGDPVKTATMWRDGLRGSGLGEPELQALQDRMSLRVLTPGSTAGTPVDLLGALSRPPAAVLHDAEARRELVADTVGGLLALTGRKSDPVRDPAHVVMSQILEMAWQAGEPVDLATLALALMDPPFDKVGVFPLDRFFKPKDREALALDLNALIASPAMATWSQGVPLDPAAWMTPTPEGKVPVTVLYLAHLDETERQFFLGLLLGQVLAWTRSLRGTSSLRGLLFFDEVAGYLPPHPKNPATKAPLLTMMKQARAVGVGVVLATQNPVDLDYKALSNAGLWAIGRLNTPQDRKRLLAGLERPDLDDTVADLPKRHFLLHRAGKEPVTLSTRWAMSFLRGPMTRQELALLPSDLPPRAPAEPAPAQAPAPAPASPPSATPRKALWGRLPSDAVAPPPPPLGRATPPPRTRAHRPAPPARTVAAAPAAVGTLHRAPPTPDIDVAYLPTHTAFAARLNGYFADHAGSRDAGAVWQPAVFAEVVLTFDEPRHGFEVEETKVLVAYPLGDRAPTALDELDLAPADLAHEADVTGSYGTLPTWMDEASERKTLQRKLLAEVHRRETEGTFVHKALKLHGRAGETREQFAERVKGLLQDKLDEAAEKLRDKHEDRVDRLDDKISKKEQQIVEAQGVAQGKKLTEMVNLGETVFSMFSGRRRSLTTALSRRSSSASSAAKVDRYEDELARLQEEANELVDELKEDLAKLEEDLMEGLHDIEDKEVPLDKDDLRVVRFGVLWVPATRRL